MKQETENKPKAIIEKRIGESVKKTKPLVSIIIPLYAPDHISETLESVFAQTFTDYEIVLVNDGSPKSDELEQVLQPYFEKIVYIIQENAGSPAARNTSIRAARGELLAFLDHDDIWYSEYLEEQLKVRKQKECDLFYCDALLFGDVRNENETFSMGAPSDGPVNSESLIASKCNVITSGTIVSRKSVMDCGLFDEDLRGRGFEDFDLWFRLSKKGVKSDYQKKVLLKYRIHQGNLSGGTMQIAARDVVILDFIREKYDLTESEKETLRERRIFANAYLDIEKAKSYLSNGEYANSIEHLKGANDYYKSFKLRLVIWLLKINPKLAVRIFKVVKPDTLEIPPTP